jgi:outer membrane protein OmpA-like peptidoglycan-associated protein
MTPTVPASPKRTQTRDTAIVAKESAPVATPKSEFSVPAPILKSDSLITLSEFLFETDSHTLREKHFSQLDSIGAFLLTHPTLEVNISGHTDNTGNESHNVTLSQRRAEGVAQYLAGKGVAPGKIKFQGFGSAKPIQGNQTKEGRSKNRRVEILISNPKKK